MKQMQQGHIYAFDVMRLVAAFFVVMIHCAASRSVSGLVYNTVARFSVPVFVLISGYILLPSDRETGYFLQKCARTFGTLLLTAGLYACYQLLTGRMVDTGVKALVKTLLCEPSHLWYLYAAMALYLLTPLLRVFHWHARQQEYVYALAVCFFFGSVVYTLVYSGWFPVVNQLMDNTKLPGPLGFVALYLTGGYLARFGVAKPVRRWIYGLAAAATAAAAAATCILSARGVRADLFLSFFAPNAVLGGTAVFLLVQQLCGSCAWEHPRRNRMLAAFASATAGVYLIHPLWMQLLQDWFGPWLPALPPVWSIPLRTLTVFTLSLVTVVAFQRLRRLLPHQ